MKTGSPSRFSVARLPILVGAITLVSMVSVGLLIFRSGTDPTFAVEPDYYAKALNWDKQRRAAQESAALGWTADLVSALPGPVAVLHLTDQSGARISDATITGIAFAHRNASRRAELKFTASAQEPGAYQATLPVDAQSPAGLWRISIIAERGGQRFLVEQDVEVSAP